MKIDKYHVFRYDVHDSEFSDMPIYVYRVGDVTDKDEYNFGYFAEFNSRKHAAFFLKALNSGKIK